MVGICENGNEPPGFLKSREVLVGLSTYNFSRRILHHEISRLINYLAESVTV
jgi:hypothetical protein